MDDTQRIVKCGNLALHTPGGFFKKRWHSKYLVLYDGSKSGVKRLELFESEIKFKKQSPVKIIPLVDCVRIVTCQRHKTTFTFEVRTSDQFYLLASKSFQDMNDWVNCLRFVAFGQQQHQGQTNNTNQQAPSVNQLLAVAAVTQRRNLKQPPPVATTAASCSLSGNSTGSSSGTSSSSSSSPASSSSSPSNSPASSAANLTATPAVAAVTPQKRNNMDTVDVLLPCHENRQQTNKSVSALSNGGQAKGGELKTAATPIMTASQAAAAAASALARTRQRQPSLLGSCKPQPPTDSPFIQHQQQVAQNGSAPLSAATGGSAGGQIDTLTPTVRGQLIAAATSLASNNNGAGGAPLTSSGLLNKPLAGAVSRPPSYSSTGGRLTQTATSNLDEEEENMLYCSIEDNPSEHNYRVKVIETELALRCQLKCYQLTASTTISQQYEELSQFRMSLVAGQHQLPQMVTFYQLIIGPQELTLLNDYATTSSQHARAKTQGLWSWPYQCIRRYGFDKDNCFMFEAGRKCTSGPGQFVVQTPKAYNIYQDVVKFVNELRTISGCSSSLMPTTTNNNNNDSMAAASQSADTAHVAQSQAVAVTQIPVTWTPNCVNTHQQVVTIPNEPNDNSRRQFFDALRQLDANQTHAPASQAQENERPPLANNISEQQQVLPATIAGHQRGGGAQLASLNSINSLKDHQHHPESISQISKSHDSTLASEQAPPLPVRSESSARAKAVAQLESRLMSGGNNNNNNKITSAPQRSAVGKQVAAEQQQQRQQLASSGSISSNGSAVEDETDESGYEQGDESVDSGHRQRVRTSTAGSGAAKSNKCQQASNSSDLSSGSSSSSSNSSSPGQSVSRRTGQAAAAVESRCSRLPLPESLTGNLTSASGGAPPQQPAAVGGKAQSRLAPINQLAKINDQQEDFEASLIRDVYSEITKLHAKFAVTTNHGTDEGGSMSSGESHTTSCSATCSDDNLETLNEEEDDYDSMESEPMYTNLGCAGRGRRRVNSPPNGGSRAPPASAGTNHTSHQFRVHQQQQQQMHQYDHVQQQHLYRGPPHYPTMLNPIPEIAEQQQQQTERSRSHCHITGTRQPLHNSNTNNNNDINTGTKLLSSRQPSRVNSEQQTRQTAPEIISNNTSDIDKLKEAGGSPRARLALNREAIKRSQQSIGPNTRVGPRTHCSSSSSAPGITSNNNNRPTSLSTKPTNHYLINDVQYAKISRNTTRPMTKTGGANHHPVPGHQRRS